MQSGFMGENHKPGLSIIQAIISLGQSAMHLPLAHEPESIRSTPNLVIAQLCMIYAQNFDVDVHAVKRSFKDTLLTVGDHYLNKGRPIVYIRTPSTGTRIHRCLLVNA